MHACHRFEILFVSCLICRRIPGGLTFICTRFGCYHLTTFLFYPGIALRPHAPSFLEVKVATICDEDDQIDAVQK